VSATQLAAASNAAVYAAMVTLTFAMVSFAISFASGRRRLTEVPVAPPEINSVGSTAVLTKSPVLTTSAGGTPPDGQTGRRSANIGMSLTWLGFVVLLAGVVLRGVWAGRVPWGNMYEFSITSALGILGVFLLISLRRDVRWLGLFIVIPTLLTLGLAVTVLYTEAAQLVPALKSYWLIIHVSAAIICAGAFTLAAATAALALVQSQAERHGKSGLARVPSAEKLRTLTYRVLAFAFPLWTFAVVAGAIWAENAWGRYWGWDPKETWAFITWVIYAAYLHARSTVGWRGDRASWVAIAGWAAFIVNYFGVNIFINSLHSYSGV
jgi:cytochrome c-type biogenesis protein CcsB